MQYDLDTVAALTSELSVLYVEDDPQTRQAMEGMLEALFAEVRSAENGEEALRIFGNRLEDKGEGFDLVISDIEMPVKDGIAMSRELLERFPEQEIVIFSARDERSGLIEMINLGIGRFLLKPIEEKQLYQTFYIVGKRIALRREKQRLMEEVQRLNTELERKMEAFRRLAYEDSLTGAANRRAFFEKAPEWLKRSRESGAPLFLFVVDIDRFKTINDTYGHGVGDGVLRFFVETVRRHLDESSCFARLGGDEFIIMMHDCTFDEAYARADRIRTEIDRLRNIGDVTLRFTVSIGMTSLWEEDETVDDLIRRADKNLYQAKDLARNRVRG